MSLQVQERRIGLASTSPTNLGTACNEPLVCIMIRVPVFNNSPLHFVLLRALFFVLYFYFSATSTVPGGWKKIKKTKKTSSSFIGTWIGSCPRIRTVRLVSQNSSWSWFNFFFFFWFFLKFCWGMTAGEEGAESHHSANKKYKNYLLEVVKKFPPPPSRGSEKKPCTKEKHFLFFFFVLHPENKPRFQWVLGLG